MKHSKFIIAVFCILSFKFYTANAQPLMGWSSWNANHVNINETLLKATADSMISLGLKDVGYTWVNIDDGYFNGRDSEGHLQVNAKFPNGMKTIADYIRSKGLNPGIYSEIGVNTCANIYENDASGANSGLYGHEEQDLRLFFDTWGYDFIKVDYCSGQKLGLNEQTTYTYVGNIINQLESELGRDLRYNICRWSFPGTWAADVADSWRISGDINDTYASIKNIIDLNTYLAPYCSKGHYNDMDMLQLGGRLTEDEEKTHFGLWAIMNSPLVIGCNLGGVRQSTLDILKNTEIIALNQDTLDLQAELVMRKGNGLVFAKSIEIRHGKIRAVALFNAGNAEKIIRVKFKDIQLGSRASIRDLWEHTDLGEFTDYYETTVPAHSTAMLRIEGDEAIDQLRYQGEYAYMNKFAAINLAQNARFIKPDTYIASGSCVMGYLGNHPDNWAEYPDVYVSQGGTYTFRLYYVSGENRNLSVIVNGISYPMQNLYSGGWATRATAEIQIQLNAGSNVIRLANPSAFAPDIDKFELIPAGGTIEEDDFEDTTSQFPIISSTDDSNETWYWVQFKSSDGVLQDMGENEFLLTKSLDENNVAQQWKVVQASNPSGEYKYQFVSRAGGALMRVSVTETSDGFYKTTNNLADWVKFRIVATTNSGLKPAWELERQGTTRHLNQFDPTQTGIFDKNISEWTANDAGNPVVFIPVRVDDTGIVGGQLIAPLLDKNASIYDVSGRKVGKYGDVETQRVTSLPSGIYFSNEKKIIVKN
ncbi:MAG: alpha-galactosidase [Dysgonamonadaceae bacterium]|jgi:hypothetical protein|nr:alpha-galactosidase [Dysgonamonadaceae bacterium]